MDIASIAESDEQRKGDRSVLFLEKEKQKDLYLSCAFKPSQAGKT
jgi:hypothetical protein